MVFIAIAGNIGVGKTTLAKLIEKKLKFRLYEESVQTEILSRFYEHVNANVKPSELAFLLQKSFLGIRTAAHLDMQVARGNCVQDRTVYEDRYIFAKHLNKTGFISNERLELYNKLFALQMKGLKKPDLLVFLWAHPTTLRERIKLRGRKMEEDLIKKDNPYLDELDILYKSLRRRYVGEVLDLNSEKFDLRKAKDQEEVIDMIKKRVF